MIVVDIGPIHPTHPHLFADAIETLVILGDKGPFSKSDAFSLMNQTSTSEEDVIADVERDLDDDNHDDSLSTAEISESKQRKIDAAFAQFGYRERAFGCSYPFELDNDRNLILKEEFHDGQITYAFLLCCARLRSFGTKAAQTNLANKFEDLCAIAIKGMVPPHAEVIQFGPTTAQRATFGASMRDAIPKLAKHIGVPLAPRWEDVEETPQGDGGIDLIALISLDGEASHTSESWTLTAQCAAHERASSWERKVLESYRGLTKRLSFQHRPSNALFIPGAYRKTDGTWPVATKDKDALLMDRVRIIHNIANLTDSDTMCWGWLINTAERALDLTLLEKQKLKVALNA